MAKWIVGESLIPLRTSAIPLPLSLLGPGPLIMSPAEDLPENSQDNRTKNFHRLARMCMTVPHPRWPGSLRLAPAWHQSIHSYSEPCFYRGMIRFVCVPGFFKSFVQFLPLSFINFRVYWIWAKL